jgi:hypothetical protein
MVFDEVVTLGIKKSSPNSPFTGRDGGFWSRWKINARRLTAFARLPPPRGRVFYPNCE